MLVSIDDERLIAGFTTKFGGVSSGVYAELNLAMHVGDNANNVEKNRQILCQKIGANRLIFMDQIHSDKVEALNDINQILDPCDSVFTGISKVGLCVMVADCSPVLIYDKAQDKIAAIHAGRAGIVQKIISKSIEKMNSNPKNLSVIIGPNISKNCYEIKNLDLGEFNRFIKDSKFDMNLAIKDELEGLGVDNYRFLNICSHCDDRFYSYRKNGVTGRFAGFIMLKDKENVREMY